MKKRKLGDAIEVIAQFQKEIMGSPVTTETMFEEVRMMRFKIRPLSGDVLALNLQDKEFIQALWSLGKLDEFFHRHYNRLGVQERQLFFDMFDNLHERFEAQLNKLDLIELQKKDNDDEGIEMEIFKEYPTKKKFN